MENLIHLMMIMLELVELLKIFVIYENEDLVNVLMMDFEEMF
jgi:hypothetical protein